MTRQGVAVYGSINHDLVLRVPHLAAPGETVLALGVLRGAGGKGANQAVASARDGARTSLIGAVGTDAEGRAARDALAAAGVDVTAVRTADAPTGVAVVTVAADGENSIVVDEGANGALRGLTATDRDLVARSAVLLLQLECPPDGIVEAAAFAAASGTPVVLNAAPARPLPAELAAAVDLLVVNAQEARQLLGWSGDQGPGAALDALAQRFPQVVLTRGADGAWFGDRAGRRVHQPAVPATPVDTTAAGDTFCGVLAAELSRGLDAAAALPRASAAAGLCVRRMGAIDAIPTADETTALLDARS